MLRDRLAAGEASTAILRVVRDQGPISRSAVARQLGISPSTSGRLIDTLLADGVLLETDQRQGVGAGRPSIPLQINPQIASVLTVDLRLTEAYVAITGLTGDFLYRGRLALTVGEMDRSIAELVAYLRGLLASLPEIPPVEIIVIGAPSIVDVRTGVIEWAPSLQWKNLPMRQILETELNCQVYVENDVNLAVLGEFWKGAGRAADKNLVFVSVGTGIGAGIILDGELYRGSHFAAGEVAYFVTDVSVLRDNVGRIGSLENRVGSEKLLQMAHLVAQRYPASQLADLFRRTDRKVKPPDIISLAGKGDPASLVIFNELVDSLTIVICNIAVVLDPELIIIGGPGDMDWPVLIAAIQNRIGASLLQPVNLIPSRLGSDALIMGGAYAALSHLHF
jgi:predicted NBD/HSP70 family sugar kinase